MDRPDLFGTTLRATRSRNRQPFKRSVRIVRPVLWRGVKAVGRETLRNGGKRLSDLANNTSSDDKTRHIIAKYVSDSAQTLIQKLRGKGCKRAAALKPRGLPSKEGENEGDKDYKNGHLFIGRVISFPTMAAEVVSASTEFDIFSNRSVQTSTIETIETAYKPIASLYQNDLEFLIPADLDKYIDLNIQLYVRGILKQADGTDLEPNDTTCVANNLLHSLFEQCNI